MPGISKHVFTALIRSRRLGASIAATAVLAAFSALQPAAGVASTTNPWLDRLNQWRTSTGVGPLTENSVYSSGDYNHSVYMVKNDLVTHYETPGVPYYTTAGDTAARNSNIEVNSSTAFTDTQSIDWWMAAPFHSMGMMDPRLTQTGFGAYREAKSGWAAGFSLDTIHGNSFTGGSYPVYFPGNGTTEPLTNYSGNEFPDPLSACPNYTMPTGLPVYIEVGGNVNTTVGPVHTLTGGGTSLANCVIDSSNSSVGSYLYTRGGVIMVPQRPLQTGVTYTVALTVNSVPYTWTFTVGNFASAGPPPAGWVSIGGTLTSSAAASSWGTARVDVFSRDSNNALAQNTWNGTTWSGWSSQGGVLTSSPAAVAWGPNRIDAFVRGQDNGLYHKAWNGTTWSPYENLGGYLLSGAAGASWSSGRLDLFVIGGDRGLYHKYWAGFWSTWQSLGGVLTSDPAAVSWGPNRIDVFARGQDNALWQESWDGTKWSWQSRGGVITSGPAASSCASGHLDVFATGQDYAIYQLGYTGTWGAWTKLGGQWTTQPGAVCSTVVHLIERGPDSAMWQTTVTGS